MSENLSSVCDSPTPWPNEAEIRLDNASLRFIRYGSTRTGMKEAMFSKLFKASVKKTDDFWVIHDVTQVVSHGEQLGIIGVNGAGKTTLLKLIAGIYRPTRGRITVTGSVAPLIEIGAGFKTELTGRENILLYGTLLGHSVKDMTDKVDSILDFAELQGAADMPMKYFSSGMLRRLGFAVATDIQPDILLVDEVFGAGDAFFNRKARRRMEDLLDSSKITVIVSHNLELIQDICTRAIWLEEGAIVADGAPEDVCRRYLGSRDA